MRRRGALFVDTSAWVASLRASESCHGQVLEHLDAPDGDLVTSTRIVDETLTLVRRRISHAAAVVLGRRLLESGAVVVLPVAEEVWRDAWLLFAQRPEQDYSLTDCSSFVLMRSLGIDRALTLDRDFEREGFVVLP